MEMMEQPLASIVVITYNQEHSLPVTLDCLLKQKTNFPIEIVVGEDCSTDGTREVLADYAQRYPDVIHPIYNEKNKGILGNYVSTLSQCRGKYISGCAGDDHWDDEQKLQMQVDIMESHPEVGLVYTDVIVDSVATNQRLIGNVRILVMICLPNCWKAVLSQHLRCVTVRNCCNMWTLKSSKGRALSWRIILCG